MGYDVAAVGRHYDEQLARAGWTASSVGTSPPVTWSTWTLTDHEGEPWWAILFAVQLPTTPERYALTFRAEAVRPDAHAGQSGGSGFISVGSSRMISSDYHPPTPS
jgi:hypothetical protein